MTFDVEVALAVAALPVLVAAAYLAVLALASGELPPAAPVEPRLSFDVVVPAHDEEAGIAATVRNLLALDWPRALFRVVVVADNCSDATAERARAAGAEVMVRTDPQRRGKGHALAFAFAASAADAVVVVDADTVASANLLQAFASRIAAGARAVQADYGVANPEASWRTRLMAIALALFHVLRSRGRERLRLSCGLRGNGMCFTTALLREVPHEAFSIVEDLEYGIRLGLAGHRVHYAGEAHVRGEMVAGEHASRSQRRRWEGGRWLMARTWGARLLRLALARRDRVLLDLALDVLVPPLATVVAVTVAGLAASVAWAVHRGEAGPAVWLWAFSLAALTGYVARGWRLSGTGLRGLLDLACAPAYIAWKAALALRRAPRVPAEWVRTSRSQ